MKRYLSSARLPLTALGGALLAVALVLVYLKVDPQDGRYSDADIQRLADERIAEITPTPPLEPEIYALVRPAVVLIQRNPGTSEGIGSGVVVDEFGSILTSYHVVEGLRQVSVRFFDGSTAMATVDREEPERDLAVIKVPSLPAGVQPAVLSGGARPGDRVMTIGAPFGLDGSVSAGIISATGRNFVVKETGQLLTNMIQFDANANPGNSGGPLVDLNGRVVGIVTGLVNPTNDGVFVGLGFAVPIEAASGVFAPLG
ncbi:MAG TPA: trypsin-like peptidase domain-containing protein [Dehalococcoidia bacterium]|nr:trypsin-like peptidase domain-containing protein [Dehalococcoidia bacterium]